MGWRGGHMQTNIRKYLTFHKFILILHKNFSSTHSSPHIHLKNLICVGGYAFPAPSHTIPCGRLLQTHTLTQFHIWWNSTHTQFVLLHKYRGVCLSIYSGKNDWLEVGRRKKNDWLEVGRRKKNDWRDPNFWGNRFLSVVCYSGSRVLEQTFYRAFLTNFREKKSTNSKSVTFKGWKVLVFEVRNFE